VHKLAWGFVSTVKAQAPEFFIGKRVLEVGSMDINGSVRDLFTSCDYFGIDLGEGKGVDEVRHVTQVFLADATYDVIISTEALEHDELWNLSLKAMYRLLKPNGVLIITCAGPDRAEHGTRKTEDWASPHTTDYYRNISVEDFASVLPAELFSKSQLVYCGYEGGEKEDLYFVGIKKSQGGIAGLLTIPEEERRFKPRPSNLTVTAEVCTKDRPTTLPMTISAILNQTHKPQRLVIYNDGEPEKLEDVQPIEGLLRMALDKGINWTVYATPKQGQVACHQHAIEDAQTDVIFRVDDDEIPEPNCLENLLAEMTDGVGAVGGLVHHPGGVVPLPDWVDGSLNDVTKGVNMQWYQFNGGPQEASHLYSTFIFRIDAARKAGGYCRNLSPAGHREETMFSNSIHRAGYKLIVTPNAKTWHLRQPTGGIRSYSDGSLWDHDEVIFQEYLRMIGVPKGEEEHLVILNSGLGDHLIYRALLVDEFMRKYPERKWLLSVCYPDVFEDIPNVRIISIAEAQIMVGDREMEYNVYHWAWQNNKQGSIVDTMREFYGARLCA
jgi:glycosyltransferase involved in cell wall biosynthesis/SAM-dependent methyltransferase